ncbi:Nicotinate-nucleotide--dimethylbenzimidazole phosphoribosyltransferase [gamma proteobacterium HdN1]|nr:Nicotinate-nucleotide--dimethylbenzimidazole phosphoribosyltransferase [gamma proteobacterium HdN1]
MSTSYWWQEAAPNPNPIALIRARQRQNQLTKPQGSLGRLEAIAVRLAALQDTETPHIDKVAISVFAGDHGVVEEGVSAFPQAVTTEMMKNFVAGGAAISVLARHLNATLRVVNVGGLAEAGSLPGVVDRVVRHGTANFCKEPAMSTEDFIHAMAAGQAEAKVAIEQGADLVIGGEMGIGNTTSATALLSHWLDLAPSLIAGPGTGLDAAGVSHKAQIVERAIQLHAEQIRYPETLLQHLGGIEIVALAGYYIAAAQGGKAILVDGFICTAAALLAIAMNTSVSAWMFFSHTSAEPGYKVVKNYLPSPPILDLQMRLGEGSGAAVCVPLLKMACALHNEMATFEQAQVSNQEGTQ